MDNTKKYGFTGLNLELTRRCNLCCPHCSRGDAQNLIISEKIIDTMLSQTLSITDLVITGGEPLLEIDKLEYLVNSLTLIPSMAQDIEYAASVDWIEIFSVRSFFYFSGELFLKKSLFFPKTYPIVDVYCNRPQ